MAQDPELAGVTELRVHGVGGATPAELLGDPAPRQVSGDDVAGFYRTRDAGGRHVEAYSWGGLTSRSATRILWLLLLPFMLANVAGWMCPRTLPGRRVLFAVYRAVVRWAALALTLNLVLLLTAIGSGYAGYQCGGRAGCASPWWLWPLAWPGMAESAGRRILLGAVVPLAAIALLALLAQTSRRRYEAVAPPVQQEEGQVGAAVREGPAVSAAALAGGMADPWFWDGHDVAARLSRAHTSAAIAFLAALIAYTGHAAGPPGWPAAYPLALGLAGLTLLGALAALAGDRLLERLEPWLGPASWAALAAAAVFAWTSAAGPGNRVSETPGLREAITVFYAGFGLTVAALAVVLAVAAVTGGGQGERGFRWGAPVVVVALAGIGLNLVLIGLLIRVSDVLGAIVYGYTGPATLGGEPVIVVFPMFGQVMAYLVFTPVAFVAIVLGVRFVRLLRVPSAEVETEYRGREAGEQPQPGPRRWYVSALADRAWALGVARARWVSGSMRELDLLFTGLALLGVALLAWAQWRFGQAGPPPPLWLVTVGAAVASLIPVGFLAALRLGWSDAQNRRMVGVLWDVGTFWPRCYHPFSPPAYPERAIPELQRRMWWLHDNGGRVLLVGHSQGSILAIAALLQPGCLPSGGRFALLTFGSPAHKLYNWAFPAYFHDDVLSVLAGARCWVNVHYLTDPLGGPAFSSARPAVDRLLPDPPSSLFQYGQPYPPIGGHGGYWIDPAVWKEADTLAATLTSDETPGVRG
ncbi:hypothetical protein [Nonomuraea typhae]|uniref:Lipase family protein n=1 Tax=Nonomuraea typhae TaxID=2603600 RepID=A0ABW7ZA55_9ACTN